MFGTAAAGLEYRLGLAPDVLVVCCKDSPDLSFFLSPRMAFATLEHVRRRNGVEGYEPGVKIAMEDEDEEPLERVADGEEIEEGKGGIANRQRAEQPRNAKKREEGHCGFDALLEIGKLGDLFHR